MSIPTFLSKFKIFKTLVVLRIVDGLTYSYNAWFLDGKTSTCFFCLLISLFTLIQYIDIYELNHLQGDEQSPIILCVSILFKISQNLDNWFIFIDLTYCNKRVFILLSLGAAVIAS